MKPAFSPEGIKLIEEFVALPSSEDILIAAVAKELQQEHMNMWVDSWHDGIAMETLKEYMGFKNDEEYSAWLLHSEAIPPHVIEKLNAWIESRIHYET